MNLINGNRDSCWCPVCQKNDRKAGYICPWFGPPPERAFICEYGACKSCGDIVQAAPERLRTEMADRIEQNLIARYPKLLEKLPPGYLTNAAKERAHD